MYDEIFLPYNRPNATMAMIVVTDGKSGDDVLAPADQMRELGLVMVSVGYAGAVLEELAEIANQPTEDHMYKVLQNFQIMIGILFVTITLKFLFRSEKTVKTCWKSQIS